MKTCFRNCQIGDRVIWSNGIDSKSFEVFEICNNDRFKVFGNDDDGDEFCFTIPDLYPNDSNDYKISKIVKAKK